MARYDYSCKNPDCELYSFIHERNVPCEDRDLQQCSECGMILFRHPHYGQVFLPRLTPGFINHTINDFILPRSRFDSADDYNEYKKDLEAWEERVHKANEIKRGK